MAWSCVSISPTLQCLTVTPIVILFVSRSKLIPSELHNRKLTILQIIDRFQIIQNLHILLYYSCILGRIYLNLKMFLNKYLDYLFLNKYLSENLYYSQQNIHPVRKNPVILIYKVH